MPVELFWTGNNWGMRPIQEAQTLRKSTLLNVEHISEDMVNPLLKQHSGSMLSLEMTAQGDTVSVLLCSGEKQQEIRYNRQKKRLMVLDADGNEIGRYRGSVDDVDIGSEPIRFTCYLDHSLLEVYLNDVKSVSLRNYFTEPRHFQVRGDIQQLKLWEMSPAYPDL